MYQNEIGKAAGEVWRYLDKNSPAPMEKTRKDLKNINRDLFQQALGWLAREDKIDINTAQKPIMLSKKH